jgi:hypothetical protein
MNGSKGVTFIKKVGWALPTSGENEQLTQYNLLN